MRCVIVAGWAVDDDCAQRLRPDLLRAAAAEAAALRRRGVRGAPGGLGTATRTTSPGARSRPMATRAGCAEPRADGAGGTGRRRPLRLARRTARRSWPVCAPTCRARAPTDRSRALSRAQVEAYRAIAREALPARLAGAAARCSRRWPRPGATSGELEKARKAYLTAIQAEDKPGSRADQGHRAARQRRGAARREDGRQGHRCQDREGGARP